MRALPLRNKCERKFEEEASKRGWSVTKRGWPDFAMFRGGRFACVEVKPDGEFLKPSQMRVMKELSKKGIDCYLWTPSGGFQKIV